MALKSPDDPRDLIYEALAQERKGKMPVVIDLRCYAFDPLDQGRRGTCAPISGAAIREIRRSMNLGKWTDDDRLSPEFIYFHREYPAARGMHGRDVFRILHERGIPPESFHPYGRESKPGRKAYKEAKKNRIGGYAKVTTPDGLKQALYHYGACYMSLPCYNDSAEFWRRKNGLSLPRSHKGQRGVGHAVVVVGYNKYGFILRNSWGDNWNGDGHTILPYKDWSRVWECWVPLADIEKDTRWKKFKRLFKKSRAD